MGKQTRWGEVWDQATSWNECMRPTYACIQKIRVANCCSFVVNRCRSLVHSFIYTGSFVVHWNELFNRTDSERMGTAHLCSPAVINNCSSLIKIGIEFAALHAIEAHLWRNMFSHLAYNYFSQAVAEIRCQKQHVQHNLLSNICTYVYVYIQNIRIFIQKLGACFFFAIFVTRT